MITKTRKHLRILRLGSFFLDANDTLFMKIGVSDGYIANSVVSNAINMSNSVLITKFLDDTVYSVDAEIHVK